MGVKRMTQAELLFKAKSVKTFNHHVYEVKGMFVVDKENGSIKSIDDVYYTTRTVLDQKRSVIAKRKHINDELAAVN